MRRSSMNLKCLQKPASEWSEKHLRSLHVTRRDGTPLEDFDFARYMPEDGDHGMIAPSQCKDRLATELKVGTRDSGHHLARNDGCVVLRGRDGIEAVPIISFEAKKRDLGNRVHYPEHSQEPYRADIFGQEVALLYGQACACSVDGTGDVVTGHTGWLITMHGTRLRLLQGDFSRAYLCGVRSKTLARTQLLVVKRSDEFNVKYPDRRVEALKAVMGLLRFIKLGTYRNAYLERLGAR
ncbi:uncharacterized protein BO80DRAFT_445301 [Aspergillus ibericus CBS 121593]|uniref:Uncharacterized protein n=1 Tax=Aspergillus ibericus CBS 121593 TaxID=1448316 RepID=A0A395GYD3_9EURO|nr:hypothetical protein BO80DRAFT_445301 [Aspergillus ibericus CBS 121593]RAL00577.1 hypothetical protein BO80DRAFT_445301 [Aspergillus ibericus CBS 121593]